jgi:hypothetical protein
MGLRKVSYGSRKAVLVVQTSESCSYVRVWLSNDVQLLGDNHFIKTASIVHLKEFTYLLSNLTMLLASLEPLKRRSFT